MLVAISKGMLAVKLYSSKILEFLTGGFQLYNGCKMVVVVVVVAEGESQVIVIFHTIQMIQACV